MMMMNVWRFWWIDFIHSQNKVKCSRWMWRMIKNWILITIWKWLIPNRTYWNLLIFLATMAFAAARMILKDKRRKPSTSHEEYSPRNRSLVYRIPFQFHLLIGTFLWRSSLLGIISNTRVYFEYLFWTKIASPDGLGRPVYRSGRLRLSRWMGEKAYPCDASAPLSVGSESKRRKIIIKSWCVDVLAECCCGFRLLILEEKKATGLYPSFISLH